MSKISGPIGYGNNLSYWLFDILMIAQIKYRGALRKYIPEVH